MRLIRGRPSYAILPSTFSIHRVRSLTHLLSTLDRYSHLRFDYSTRSRSSLVLFLFGHALYAPLRLRGDWRVTERSPSAAEPNGSLSTPSCINSNASASPLSVS